MSPQNAQHSSDNPKASDAHSHVEVSQSGLVAPAWFASSILVAIAVISVYLTISDKQWNFTLANFGPVDKVYTQDRFEALETKYQDQVEQNQAIIKESESDYETIESLKATNTLLIAKVADLEAKDRARAPLYAHFAKEPKKRVQSLNGIQYKTIGRYSDHKIAKDFLCDLKKRNDQDLIVIQTRDENIGKSYGRCLTDFAFCNGAGESCVEQYFVQACFINKDWHNWYKEFNELIGRPYTKEGVCA
ncbi:hypothetical protein [Alteromonas gracilis]|uniref:hypothetical protein n=1 Tax=Alteromonas gracilis TaxID=1479524 RepID=UPI0030D56566